MIAIRQQALKLVIIASAHMDKNNKRGYTLVEILIVITIIAFFSGLSIAAFNIVSNQKLLEGETRKFVEILELAKKKTLSGDTPCAQYLGRNQVVWTSTQYILTPEGCSSAFTYNMPSAIVITQGGNIYFEPLGQTVTAKNIIIKNNNNSACRQVVVEQSGNIYENSIACP